MNIKKEIKQELLDINNILVRISEELKVIYDLTYPSGEMSELLQKNTTSLQYLAKLCKIEVDLSKSLKHSAEATHNSQNDTHMLSNSLHDTFRNESFD